MLEHGYCESDTTSRCMMLPCRVRKVGQKRAYFCDNLCSSTWSGLISGRSAAHWYETPSEILCCPDQPVYSTMPVLLFLSRGLAGGRVHHELPPGDSAAAIPFHMPMPRLPGRHRERHPARGLALHRLLCCHPASACCRLCAGLCRPGLQQVVSP